MVAPPGEDISPSEELTAVGLMTSLTRQAGSRWLPRLTVTGHLDISTTPQFSRAVSEIAADQKVILDLTRAEFIGSAAISVLFEQRERFAAVLVGADTIVDLALSAAGFPTIPTHRDRGPALSGDTQAVSGRRRPELDGVTGY